MRTYKNARVSIIIAAKNEGEGLDRILQEVKPYGEDILVVDGHSTDHTKQIAKKHNARYFLDNKKGRGDALKIGIRHAKGKVIVFFDADGSHESKDIPHLIKPILNNTADLVICSRRTGGSFDATITLSGMLRSFGSDLLVYIVNKRFGTNFTDIIYSFRALNATKAKTLPIDADGFEVEQEMVISAIRNGFRIREIPSREKARGWGVSKLRTIAGSKLLFHAIRYSYFK